MDYSPHPLKVQRQVTITRGTGSMDTYSQVNIRVPQSLRGDQEPLKPIMHPMEKTQAHRVFSNGRRSMLDVQKYPLIKT